MTQTVTGSQCANQNPQNVHDRVHAPATSTISMNVLNVSLLPVTMPATKRKIVLKNVRPNEPWKHFQFSPQRSPSG